MGKTVVKCRYPEGNRATPPEGFEEWNTGGDCSHDYCIDAEQWRREYDATARYRVTREKREEIMADRELFMDEFHGRDPWQN